MKDIKLPTSIKIFIGIFSIGILLSVATGIYTGFTSIYNQTISYELEYTECVQNQVTSYDNDYLAFKEKSNIAEMNKETFIIVTEIIMTGRKDGQSVAWKWVHENQNIPYEEFTSFYRDLSSFTAMRFEKNAGIEKKKQEIAKNHNKLIATFPGILYNCILNRTELKYKEGFVSNETKMLFNK